MQEYFTGTVEDDDLPDVNTRLFEFGLNYYFRDDVRFVSSYGRQFSSEGTRMSGLLALLIAWQCRFGPEVK